MVKTFTSPSGDQRNKTNKKNQGIVLSKPRVTPGGAESLVPPDDSSQPQQASLELQEGSHEVDNHQEEQRNLIERYAQAVLELRHILEEFKKVF